MMEIVSTYCKRNLYLLNALSENEYGDFNINIGDKLLDDGHTYAAMAKDAVIEARQHLSDNETGFFEGMKKYLIPSLIENTSVNLWHYAMQKPFDQKSLTMQSKIEISLQQRQEMILKLFWRNYM